MATVGVKGLIVTAQQDSSSSNSQSNQILYFHNANLCAMQAGKKVKATISS